MTEGNVEVFVCMNVDCKSRGAEAMMARLKWQLNDRSIGNVNLQSIICFAACNVGPNVVIPSKRCWLSGVTTEDVDDVIDYIGGDTDISRLQKNNDPDLNKLIFEMIDAGLLDNGDST